jgi:transposase
LPKNAAPTFQLVQSTEQAKGCFEPSYGINKNNGGDSREIVRSSLDENGSFSFGESIAMAKQFKETARRATWTMSGIQKRLLKLRREARVRIESQAETHRKWLRLLAIPGIGELSGTQILAELAGMDEQMTVRQWVAHSGLDPAHQTSGTSVNKASRISRQGNRYLRKALFMPALTGSRFDHHLKAFYLRLLARGKTKLQALTAVARKMLHAIYGIFKTDTPYDGSKLFPAMAAALANEALSLPAH